MDLIKHKIKVEKLGLFAARLPELKTSSTEDRLKEPKLTPQEARKNRNMIITFKILKGIDKTDKDSTIKFREYRTKKTYSRWKMET